MLQGLNKYAQFTAAHDHGGSHPPMDLMSFDDSR